MEIDLFTLVAQIVNFIVLVYLLRRFLFGRIAAAMDERERRIAARIAEADGRVAIAKSEEDRCRKLREAFGQERQELDRVMREGIEKVRLDLLKDVKTSAEAERKKWMESLSQERALLSSSISRLWTDSLVSTIRKLLHDLADEDLEQRVALVLFRRMKENARLNNPSINPKGIIRTSVNWSADGRKTLEKLVDEHFGRDSEFLLQTKNDLVCGCEIEIDGTVIRWHVDDWLEQLSQLHHLLDDAMQPIPVPVPEGRTS